MIEGWETLMLVPLQTWGRAANLLAFGIVRLPDPAQRLSRKH